MKRMHAIIIGVALLAATPALASAQSRVSVADSVNKHVSGKTRSAKELDATPNAFGSAASRSAVPVKSKRTPPPLLAATAAPAASARTTVPAVAATDSAAAAPAVQRASRAKKKG